MLLKILNAVTIVLLLVISVAVIVLFFIYTGLDKRRFRIERQLDKVLPLVRKWVELVRALSADGVLMEAPEVIPACDQFLQARKLKKRLEALHVLSENHSLLVCRLGAELTEEQTQRYADMQEVEGMIQDFFSMYPLMADDYNKRLEKPVVAQCGKLMRFFPAPDLSGLDRS